MGTGSVVGVLSNVTNSKSVLEESHKGVDLSIHISLTNFRHEPVFIIMASATQYGVRLRDTRKVSLSDYEVTERDPVIEAMRELVERLVSAKCLEV